MRGFCVILTDMMSWGEVLMKNKKKSSVTIIGGADGTTSIFIAGKIGNSTVIYIVTGLCIIATAALGMFAVKRRHK